MKLGNLAAKAKATVNNFTAKATAKAKDIDTNNVKTKTIDYIKSLETSDYLLGACTLLLLDIEDTQDFISDVTAADFVETHL